MTKNMYNMQCVPLRISENLRTRGLTKSIMPLVLLCVPDER